MVVVHLWGQPALVTVSNVVVRWLVGAELELAVAEVADGSCEVLGVLAVAGVLGWKKLALDRNSTASVKVTVEGEEKNGGGS